MWKEAMLNGVVLGCVGRVVRYPDFQAQPVGQLLETVLEDVTCGGVAATPVTEQQDRRGSGIMPLPNGFPPVGDAVAGETARVVTDAQVS